MSGRLRVSALAAAALTMVALAGCAAPHPPRTEPVPPGLYPALTSACAEHAGFPAGTIVATEPEGGFSVSTDGDADPASWDALDRCVREHPIDTELRASDGVAQRRLLLLWYRSVLEPCLAEHGVEVRRGPAAADFEQIRYGVWDPYVSVRPGERPLDAVLALARECPPTPPELVRHGSTIDP